jgi:hypothetical protein
MSNCQFKFKPDKIKYLSNIDTLDSTHKKTIDSINKKHEDVPKKLKRLEKLKVDLELLDSNSSNIPNYISLRSKILDDINKLDEEINQVENYEDELDYYSKTYDILFNYYNIIDGMNQKEIDQIKNELKESDTKENYSETKPNEIKNNFEYNNIDMDLDMDSNIKLDNKFESEKKEKQENTKDVEDVENEENEENEEKLEKPETHEIWDFDGIQIFNNKSSKLDLLNQMSKMKRKEKKVTKKRVKNVESLIKDNNNIFDYIDINKSINLSNQSNQSNYTNQSNQSNQSNQQIQLNQMQFYNKPIVYDRASLYEDYKVMIEGYSSKKTISKPCINCGIDKVLIYNEGIYACMKCGEVENCIIESEITNYKDPMVEKPTFPYKRKNHFCEWTEKNCSLELILKGLANIIYLNFNRILF